MVLITLLTGAGAAATRSQDCVNALIMIREAVGNKTYLPLIRANEGFLSIIRKLMSDLGITVAEVNAMAADGKAIFSETEENTPTGRLEIFYMFGGLVQLDINKAKRLIESGHLSADLVSKPISKYAEIAYGLR